MAHGPKKKAAVVADLALGMSQRAAATKHGVSAGTVKDWANELKTTQNHAENHAETTQYPPIRQRVFQDEFYQCLIEITKGMTVMAKCLQDMAWVKRKPGGAAEIAERTTDFADRIVAQARAQADQEGEQPN